MLFTLLASSLIAAPVLQGVEVGDAPAHTFRNLDNGMGVRSLSDLRGKPVFVEYWGTR